MLQYYNTKGQIINMLLFLSSQAILSIIVAQMLLVSSHVGVSGFGVVDPIQTSKSLTTTTASSLERRGSLQSHTAIRCENKYFQLEEMEDTESCTTEVFLQEDGTVQLGQTDGPSWIEASGHWETLPDTNEFHMSLQRTYQNTPKHAHAKQSDVGDFEYQVQRTFVGSIVPGADDENDESVGITGVMQLHGNDNSNNDDSDSSAPGFFNMVDATKLHP